MRHGAAWYGRARLALVYGLAWLGMAASSKGPWAKTGALEFFPLKVRRKSAKLVPMENWISVVAHCR